MSRRATELLQGRRRAKEETAYWRRFVESIGFPLEAMPEDV
jgi:hypothetical protein